MDYAYIAEVLASGAARAEAVAGAMEQHALIKACGGEPYAFVHLGMGEGWDCWSLTGYGDVHHLDQELTECSCASFAHGHLCKHLRSLKYGS